MKNPSNHPARSVDFLSRLHDGELDAAERARFESHRAHCAECRRAAAEFESALSLFRASRTSPPPADLSARILRRLQAATPARSRQRFGIVHGINLKWAAGFAVAVIAAVVGFSVVLEREAARKALVPETPIPVQLQKGENLAAPRAKPPELEPRTHPEAGTKAQLEARRADDFAPDAPGVRGAPAENAPAAPAAIEQRKNKAAPSREAKETFGDVADSGSLRQRDAAPQAFAMERSGGEGAAAPSTASAEPGPAARLVILPLDGQGNAPEVLNPDAGEILSGLRGRRYSLLVEAGGRIREARLEEAGPRGTRPRGRASVQSVSAPPAVWSLRFKPGDRPRRLLLRVE